MSEPSATRPGAPANAHATPGSALTAPANTHDHAPEHPLAGLHGALGNLGVLDRLPELAVQPKLEVGAVDDEYEREAEAAAGRVMRAPDDDAPLSRSPDVVRRVPADDKRRPPAPSKKAPPPAPAKGPAAPAPKPTAPAAKAPAAAKPAIAKPTTAQPAAAKPTTAKPAGAKPTTAKPAVAKPTAATPAAAKPGTATPAAAKPSAATAKEAPPPRLRRPEKDHVAAKAVPGTVPSVGPGTATTIQSQQGAGRTLSPGDRAFFEPRFGRDLGGVRVHDDGAAHAAARDVRAQAFTYGQDIFFAPSRYQPGTGAGRELLAHELAHTVQQRPGGRIERRVQRATAAPAATAATPTTTTAGGATPPNGGRREGDTLHFDALEVPPFRLSGAKAAEYRRPLTRARGYKPADRRAPGMVDQRDMWRESLGSSLQSRVSTLLTLRHAQSRGGRSLVKTMPRGGAARYQIGSDLEIAQGLSTPNWDHHGRGRSDPVWVYDADHILELQVANFPASQAAHSIGNLELLEHHINVDSGNAIKLAIAGHVRDYVATLAPGQRAEFADWRNHFNVTFDTGVPSPSFHPATVGENDHWTRDEIALGMHLLRDIVTTPRWEEVGGASEIEIFQGATGGIPSKLHVTGRMPDDRLLKPFRLVAKTFEIGADWESKEDIAQLTFELAPGKGVEGGDDGSPHTFDPLPLKRLPGAQFAGYWDKGAVRRMLLTRLTAPGASPVQIDDFDIYPTGLHAQGRIVSDIALLRGAEIELTLDGDVLVFSKTFDTGDFHVPRPLQIDGSSLRIQAGTDGNVSVRGRVDASIERVGRGFVEGDGSTRHGFALHGGFTFSSDIFENPNITLGYRDGMFSGSGHLGLARGKVPGLRGGTLDVAYADGRLDASGHAQFDIPGVREADVHLSYDREHGLTIGGTLTLGALPGLRGGTLSATIAERPGGTGYRLTAHGQADPAIPGIDSSLTVDYDDGAFTAQARAAFSRGLITGSIEGGATNRPITPDGQIVQDGAPTPHVAIFGTGVATLQLTPWLHGTAAMQLLPNGELNVSGELAVPGVNLWDPIAPAPTTLLHPPTLEFPIFGPVVLEIGGSLLLRYGVGAGVLSGNLRIDYAPAHEDQTHIYGSVGLHTSAFAGLELDVFVGIGLDAWIGHVSGRILLGAELRADATLDPSIAIDWTPGRGLTLDPLLEARLTPKLVFHLDAVVSAGVGPFEKEWHKELARREFGSALAVGISVPGHYDDAHGFSVDWARKQITYPDIDPLETAKDFLLDLV